MKCNCNIEPVILATSNSKIVPLKTQGEKFDVVMSPDSAISPVSPLSPNLSEEAGSPVMNSPTSQDPNINRVMSAGIISFESENSLTMELGAPDSMKSADSPVSPLAPARQRTISWADDSDNQPGDVTPQAHENAVVSLFPS